MAFLLEDGADCVVETTEEASADDGAMPTAPVSTSPPSGRPSRRPPLAVPAPHGARRPDASGKGGARRTGTTVSVPWVDIDAAHGPNGMQNIWERSPRPPLSFQSDSPTTVGSEVRVCVCVCLCAEVGGVPGLCVLADRACPK